MLAISRLSIHACTGRGGSARRPRHPRLPPVWAWLGPLRPGQSCLDLLPARAYSPSFSLSLSSLSIFCCTYLRSGRSQRRNCSSTSRKKREREKQDSEQKLRRLKIVCLLLLLLLLLQLQLLLLHLTFHLFAHPYCMPIASSHVKRCMSLKLSVCQSVCVSVCKWVHLSVRLALPLSPFLLTLPLSQS